MRGVVVGEDEKNVRPLGGGQRTSEAQHKGENTRRETQLRNEERDEMRLAMRMSASEVDFAVMPSELCVPEKVANPFVRGSLTERVETGIRMPSRHVSAIRQPAEPVFISCCPVSELRPRPPTCWLSGTLVA